jgi:diguanylate cyclase (GGDEF)-like protein
LTRAVQEALLDDVYRRSTPAAVALVGALLLLRVLLEPALCRELALGVAYYGLVAIVLVRIAVQAWIVRRGLGTLPFRVRYAIMLGGAALSGIGMSATNLLAYPHMTPVEIGIWATTFVAVMAGAERNLAGSPAAMIAYVGPPLASFGVSLALDDRAWRTDLYLALTTLFSAALIVMGVQDYLLRRRLVQLRLEHERSSLSDPLTGLPNRRYLSLFMEREAPRVIREASSSPGSRIGLLMVDLDHFKELNDELGHEAGDAALRQISARLLECVRASDVVVRWGGEEFVVVLRDVGRDAARLIAERIRESVAAESLELPPSRACTCSIGLAMFPDPQSDETSGWEAALARADEALYRSKRAGRNRVSESPVD